MMILRAVLVLLVLSTNVVRAEPPIVDPKADKEGFVPVQPGEQLSPGESLPGGRMVGYAYGFILGAIVVWVASVAMRSRKVEEELAALRAQIEKAEKGKQG